MQLQKDPDGVERYEVVEFFSRSLIERERNYSVSEKEFLAIVSCSEKWRNYLWQEYQVITDHKPLLSMSLTEKARLQRWALRLTPYNFNIVWWPGEEMKVADTLSRDPRFESGSRIDATGMRCTIKTVEGFVPQNGNDVQSDCNYDSCTAETFDLEEIDFDISQRNNKSVQTLNREPSHSDYVRSLDLNPTDGKPLTVNMVTINQKEDKMEMNLMNVHIERQANLMEANGQALLDNLAEIMSHDIKVEDVLRPGSPSFLSEQQADPTLNKIREELLKNHKSSYEICKVSDLLMRKNSQGGRTVVVPDQMENNILWLNHEHPLAGHPSSKKMIPNIQKTFYLRGLRKKCKQWVKQCQCSRAKAKLRKKAGLTLTRAIPLIFSYLIIDVVGPFPRTRHGNTYWLTMIDAFSKDLELVALKSREAMFAGEAAHEHC